MRKAARSELLFSLVFLTDWNKNPNRNTALFAVINHEFCAMRLLIPKGKYNIIERENYNKPKSEDAKQPQCPPDKEKAIKEALKHFGMI